MSTPNRSNTQACPSGTPSSVPMTPVQFFLEHAGWSYDPMKETSDGGKLRGAELLADAEALFQKAKSLAGVEYVWDVDPDTDSNDFDDEKPAWTLYRCALIADGEKYALASLCGIDFGRDTSPDGQPYKRVVEASLASEAYDALQEIVDALDQSETETMLDAATPAPTADEVLADPSVRYWVKDALRAALSRDCCDAANDAELLARVLRARAEKGGN